VPRLPLADPPLTDGEISLLVMFSLLAEDLE